MELVKKIIVSILVVVGIALAGLIICAGVLVVFPDTKIFGVSYINTTNKDPETKIVEEIDLSAVNNGYTIEVLANNFDIEFAQKNAGGQNITAELQNNVIGFTKELDSNKNARLNYKIDSANKKLTLSIVEPDGLFLKRETVLRVNIPKQFLDKKINIISTTNKGTTTFGTQETPLRVNDVTVSCLNAKGGVKLENAQIDGNLNIKNILGRINVKNEIKGTVTINSTIGTYTFGKINNLVVTSGDEGKANNPAITLDECNNIEWKSESGNLTVKNYVFGKINVETKNANFNISKILAVSGEVLINGENSNVRIGQVGNFVEDSTSAYNSFDWKNATLTSYPVITINSGSGNILIERSYFDLALTASKGKVDVKNAMRLVGVETKSGAISVDFVDSDNFNAETELDKFIKENFVSYLDGKQTVITGGETTTTYKKVDSLKIKTNDGVVKVNNIRNSIEVNADSSPVTLNYKHVRNDSNIKTSTKQVTVKAPIESFKITTKMDKNSTSKLEIKFVGLEMNSYNDDIKDVSRMKKYNEDNFKCLDVKVHNATDTTANVITITNHTGAISVTKI